MMTRTRSVSVAIVAATALVLGACSTQPNPTASTSSYPSTSYPTTSGSNVNAQYGVVQSIERVQGEARSGVGAGAIAGAVIGGVLGNQVGGGSGKTAATVLGAAGGAYAGNEIQKRNQRPDDLMRIGVRLYNGANVSVTQEPVPDLRVGDRVLVQNGTAVRY
ncbi:MAG: glycine zipper 2TM domain-containing protein [Rhodoferax sp.]|nr:glycine zipper 2TM domain-containing protein [Rhodoferax sp.]MCP5263022.1 glycine zipper 2TM domain-containing protein [Rhodoferax sp.]